MLAEIRTKSQITLPKDIVSSMGLSEGDKLEIYEHNGMICMVPVAVYPKEVVSELYREINRLKANVKEGKQPVFDSIDALFEKLEKD